MKIIIVALIMLVLLTLSASASALSSPSQLNSFMSLSSSSTCDPVNMFSSVPQMTSMISGFPTDGSFFQSTGSSPYNQIVDQSFQWPGLGYQKPLTPIVTAPLDLVATASNNAPAITQAQKELALNIVAQTAMYKQYMQYPNDGWRYQWASPYDGHTIIMTSDINPNTSALNGMPITQNELYNPDAPCSGALIFSIDLDNGTILSQNFESFDGMF